MQCAPAHSFSLRGRRCQALWNSFASIRLTEPYQNGEFVFYPQIINNKIRNLPEIVGYIPVENATNRFLFVDFVFGLLIQLPSQPIFHFQFQFSSSTSRLTESHHGHLSIVAV